MNNVVSSGIELGWNMSQILETVIERSAGWAINQKDREFCDLVLNKEDGDMIKEQVFCALNNLVSLFTKLGLLAESSLFTQKSNSSSERDFGFVLSTKGSDRLSDYSRIKVIDDKCYEYIVNYVLYNWSLITGIDTLSNKMSLEMDVIHKEIETLIFISKTASFSKSYVVVY